MIMMGLKFTGKIPFKYVYLHGLVRDEQGRKMSKTLGNVQDPLDLIDRYGTDALRLALVTGTTPGNDINLSRDETELKDGRNFVNKLWNAARFVQAQFGPGGPSFPNAELGTRNPQLALSLPDRWIRSRAQALVGEVDRLLADFQLGQAASSIREFIWSEYCDWYLEIAKIQLRRAGDGPARRATLSTLVDVLDTALRLLHPFAPFVTEVLWQTIRRPDDAESIMIAAWPTAGPRDLVAEEAIGALQELIVAVRRLRSDYKIDWSRRVAATLEAGGRAELFRDQAAWLAALGRLEPLEIVERLDQAPPRALSVVAGGVRAFLPIEGLFDLARELERLEREHAELADLADRSDMLLASGFAQKAPPAVVQKERDKLADLRQRLTLLDDRLATLRAMDSP
jgi:valyl-tRNA synthetase